MGVEIRGALVVVILVVTALAMPVAALEAPGPHPEPTRLAGPPEVGDVSSGWVVSPDGNWAVFAAPAAGETIRSLWSVRLDGSAEAPRLLSPPGAPNPEWFVRISPDSTRVVARAALDVGGRAELHSMPIDASAPRVKLSASPSGESVATFGWQITPDSSRVVYQGELNQVGVNELYSAPIDGTASQHRLVLPYLAGAEVTSAWEVSPDSSQVGFIGDLSGSGQREVFTVPADGSAERVAVSQSPAGGNPFAPVFTPDSSQIVYRGALTTAGRTEVYSATVGTAASQVRLSGGPSGSTQPTVRVGPDGSVYYRGELEGDGATHLYRAQAGTAGTQQRLTTTTLSSGVSSWTLTPDAARIVFMASGPGTVSRLFSVASDASATPVQLSQHATNRSVNTYAVSPDSRWVAYSGELETTMDLELYSRRTDGTGPQHRLTDAASTPGAVDVFGFLRMSPDSRRVAFAADFAQPDRRDLHVATLDNSTEPQQMTDTDGDSSTDGNPVWSPDGSRMLYFGRLDHPDRFEAFTRPADGTGAQVRVHDLLEPGTVPGSPVSGAPTFAAGGAMIVYRAHHAGEAGPQLWASSRGLRPPAPTGVEVTDIGPTTARVSWAPTPAGVEVGDHRVVVRAGGGVVADLTATGRSVVVDGLAPSTAHSVEVVARGPGGNSAPATASWETAPHGGPGSPVRPGADGLERLFGGDRFATAAAVALDRFDPDLTTTVLLATGLDFPDALAGGPLAVEESAPILLTLPDALPEPTATALATLAPTRIIALGGSVAVGDEVLQAAADAAGGASSERIAGADRFATAAAIAARLGPTDRVFVATGLNFPDALAGGPATGGAPILLTAGDVLPTATAEALAAIGPDELVLLGGPAVVPDGVRELALASAGASEVTRLAGADRFSTALEVARTLGDVDTVYVATGMNFPDALAAAPAAAHEGAPIILTPPTALTIEVHEWLAGLDDLRRVVLLGGPAALSAEVEAELRVFVP